MKSNRFVGNKELFQKHLNFYYDPYKPLTGIFSVLLLMQFALAEPNGNNGLYQEAMLYLSKGDWQRAEMFLKESVNKFEDAPSCFELAKILIFRDTFQAREEAWQLLRKAIAKEPDHIGYRLLLGSLLKQMKINPSREFKKILQSDSTQVQALFELGLLKEKEYYEFHNSRKVTEELLLDYEEFAQQDFNEAESYFRKAIFYDSTHFDAHLHLALLYEDAGLPQRAIPLLERILIFYPDSAQVHQVLGLLYYQNDQYAQANQSFERALHLMNPQQQEDFVFSSAALLLEPFLRKINAGNKKSELAQVIGQYWRLNDPLFLTDYNERLLEHYARFIYANLKFSLPDLRVAGWKSERGEALIRFGKPKNWMRLRPQLTWGVAGLEFESKTDVWYYENMILAYSDEFFSGNFRFSEPALEGNRVKSQFPGDSRLLFEKLKRDTPGIYEPRWEGHSIAVPFDLLQFKSSDIRKTDLYLNYAIQMEQHPDINDREQFAHESGIFFLDNHSVKKIEQRCFVENAEPINSLNDSIKYGLNSIHFKAEPASGLFAFELKRQFDQGLSTNHFNFTVREISNTRLDLSDILLASRIDFEDVGKGTFQRGNYYFQPNPTHQFGAQQELYIYYEIYNLTLTADKLTRFEQEIILNQDKNPKAQKGISRFFDSFFDFMGLAEQSAEIILSSNYQTEEKDTPLYLKLDMSNYENGTYNLGLRITDKISGNKVYRSTALIWKK